MARNVIQSMLRFTISRFPLRPQMLILILYGRFSVFLNFKSNQSESVARDFFSIFLIMALPVRRVSGVIVDTTIDKNCLQCIILPDLFRLYSSAVSLKIYQ